MKKTLQWVGPIGLWMLSSAVGCQLNDTDPAPAAPELDGVEETVESAAAAPATSPVGTRPNPTRPDGSDAGGGPAFPDDASPDGGGDADFPGVPAFDAGFPFPGFDADIISPPSTTDAGSAFPPNG